MESQTAMLYAEDLRQLVSSFLLGRASFDSFADNYRHISRVKFGASPGVLKACLDIDAALSMVYFDDATENEFRQELQKAIRPFVAARIIAVGPWTDYALGTSLRPEDSDPGDWEKKLVASEGRSSAATNPQGIVPPPHPLEEIYLVA